MILTVLASLRNLRELAVGVVVILYFFEPAIDSFFWRREVFNIMAIPNSHILSSLVLIRSRARVVSKSTLVSPSLSQFRELLIPLLKGGKIIRLLNGKFESAFSTSCCSVPLITIHKGKSQHQLIQGVVYSILGLKINRR